jgi:tetratricopeptide (TPR) repeat protein
MMNKNALNQLTGIFLLLVFATWLSGCSTVKSTVSSRNETTVIDTVPLTQEQKLSFEYTFTEAVKQKLLGNFDNALSLLYQSLEVYPQSGAVMHEISTINELSDNIEVATKYAGKAFQNDPENKWFGMHLAQLYIVGEQYNKAIDVYKKLTVFYPENIEYLYNLARLYEETEKFEEAIETYQAMENIMGVNEQLSLSKNKLYKRIGKEKKAEKEVKKLIRHFPNETRYYGILAEMYAADNKYRKAQQMYDKLFAIDSTNNLGRLSQLEYHRERGEYEIFFNKFDKILADTAIAFQNKVMVFVSLLNSPQEMKKYYSEIEERLAFTKTKYPNQPDVYTLHADLFVKMQQFPKAVKELERVVEFGNAKWVIWEQLLSLQSFTGEFESMFKFAQRATDSFPDKPKVYLYAGMGALFTEAPEEAVSYLKKGNRLVLSEETDLQINFYTYLGEAYNDLKKYSLSDTYFDRVLRLDSTNVFVLNNYAYYLALREEDLEKALKLSKQCVAQQPDNPTYLDTYAWVLYKLERFEEALANIEKAMDKGGAKDPDVLEHYGDILNANKNLKEAIIYWNLSQTLGNKSEMLKKKIEAASTSSENTIDLDTIL